MKKLLIGFIIGICCNYLLAQAPATGILALSRNAQGISLPLISDATGNIRAIFPEQDYNNKGMYIPLVRCLN